MTRSNSNNSDPKVNQKFNCMNCYGGKRFCTASCEKNYLAKFRRKEMNDKEMTSKIYATRGFFEGPEKLVLLAVDNHSDDDGSGAWLSYEEMAAECGLSRRAVIGIVERLTSKGVLVKEAQMKTDGYPASNNYTINVELLESHIPKKTLAETLAALPDGEYFVVPKHISGMPKITLASITLYAYIYPFIADGSMLTMTNKEIGKECDMHERSVSRILIFFAKHGKLKIFTKNEQRYICKGDK